MAHILSQKGGRVILDASLPDLEKKDSDSRNHSPTVAERFQDSP